MFSIGTEEFVHKTDSSVIKRVLMTVQASEHKKCPRIKHLTPP